MPLILASNEKRIVNLSSLAHDWWSSKDVKKVVEPWTADGYDPVIQILFQTNMSSCKRVPKKTGCSKKLRVGGLVFFRKLDCVTFAKIFSFVHLSNYQCFII